MHIPHDLIIAQEQIYKPCGFVCNNLVQEQESQEYNAYTFTLNHNHIIFRCAHRTPTKTGQFVTLWKRIGTGPTMPFDIDDSFDKVIISVRQGQRLGQFIFPKQVLYEQGCVSKHGTGGKRAMRVYAPWDNANNNQAKKTQAWQCRYFFEIEDPINTILIKRLLS